MRHSSSLGYVVSLVADGLVLQPDRWAPSQRPYALLRASYKVRDRGVGGQVDAIWPGRKRGLLTVTLGTLTLWSPRHREAVGFDEAVATADLRYGGDWAHQWDGETLLHEPAYRLPPNEVPDMAAMLDEILVGFPALPGMGYEGWYYRRSE